MAAVCYDRRAQSAFVLNYERLKFATQYVDFWRSYNIRSKNNSTNGNSIFMAQQDNVCSEAIRNPQYQ